MRVSDSFSQIWNELAEDCGATIDVVSPGESPGDGVVAVIIAAGGGETEGLDLLGNLRSIGPPVYLVGANASHRFAIEATRRGANDYFVMPGDLDLLRRTLTADCERAVAMASDIRPGQAFSQILGQSPAGLAALSRAARVAEHDGVTLLVQGETGTGKELVARAVHEHSTRRDRPFVPVNCAAIPPNLMESELFGHVKGAFTDAHREKRGLFEEAHTGTLFLDEVGHLPMGLQAKILRVLEDRIIRRVGDTKLNPVDVRIISATHVDLARAVRDGLFREDLFYRLNVVSVTLPPLRERGGDLDILADAFVVNVAERYSVPVPTLSPDFRNALKRHRWPGNVRELRHAIERAVLLSPPGTLDPEELGLEPGITNTASGIEFPATLRSLSQEAARAAVEHSDGNKSAAARLLDISRPRLQRLLDGEVE